MLAIERILFPTDFSDCALQALGHAFQWARRHGANVDVLHVIEEDVQAPLSKSEARGAIKNLLAAHGFGEADVRRSVVHSPTAAEAIVAYAREHAVDLIVMGTHGRTPFGTMLIGGVAEEVIRGAPCPVLAVRQSARPVIPASFERIVVPIDFSPWAGLGIRYAKEIAAEDGATVVLLHVVEEPVAPDFSHALGDTAALDQREVGARVADELDRLYRESPGPEVEVEVHVLRGRASMEVSAFAARNGASLMVMPVHGRESRERVVLGSVTEKVVGRTPCPVLVVRPSGRQPLVERKPASVAARAVDEIC